MSELLDRLQNLDKRDIHGLRLATDQVVSLSQDFDRVVVTGTTQNISRVLLQARGFNPRKFIRFDRATNYRVYRPVGTAPEVPQNFPTEERVKSVEQLLRSNGALTEGSASILIVDDIITSGLKASGYLEVFSRVPGVEEVQFAAFATQGTRAALMSSELLARYIDRIFVPRLNDDEERNNYSILDSFRFALSSSYSPPPEVDLENRRQVRSAFSRIFSELSS